MFVRNAARSVFLLKLVLLILIC